MKYLYRILRLFFCPHVYFDKDTYTVTTSGRTVGYKYLRECKYCGKQKLTEVDL